jgi:hypothetical protein
LKGGGNPPHDGEEGGRNAEAVVVMMGRGVKWGTKVERKRERERIRRSTG